MLKLLESAYRVFDEAGKRFTTKCPYGGGVMHGKPMHCEKCLANIQAPLEQ